VTYKAHKAVQLKVNRGTGAEVKVRFAGGHIPRPTPPRLPNPRIHAHAKTKKANVEPCVTREEVNKMMQHMIKVVSLPASLQRSALTDARDSNSSCSPRRCRRCPTSASSPCRSCTTTRRLQVRASPSSRNVRAHRLQPSRRTHRVFAVWVLRRRRVCIAALRRRRARPARGRSAHGRALHRAQGQPAGCCHHAHRGPAHAARDARTPRRAGLSRSRSCLTRCSTVTKGRIVAP